LKPNGPKHFIMPQTQAGSAALFAEGVRTAVPVMLGYIPIALVLGATASQADISPLTISLMAGLNYAGGSEFAAVALWAAVPPITAIVLTTWLINSRHIMLSAAITPYVGTLPLAKKLILFAFMSDECWALAMQDITKRRKAGFSDDAALRFAFYMGIGISLWLTWVCSAFIGCAAGSGFGDLSQWGLGMAFPATFIAILAAMWPGLRHSAPWAVSFAVAGVLSLFVSSAWSIAAGAVAGLLWVWFTDKGD
jgi:predicted branched-subunit amino acid permease